MNKTLKDVGFNEFLELISGIATIEQHTILLNYEDELTGTLDELKELSKQTENIDIKRFIHQFMEENTVEFSDIDIANYLQNITNNYQKESIKLCLFELEVFENIVFYDLIDTLALNEYSRNNWDTPTIEKINRITKEIYVAVNIKEMRNKLFPFVGFQLEFAKQFLKRKLNSEIEEKTIKPPFKDAETKLIDKQTTPEINPFKDKQTAELFEYIVENWKYPATTKWGFIWNYFVEKGNGKMTFKIDYENYLIERRLMTRGKPNYEQCISQKRYNELDELKEKHLGNLDLN